MVSETETLDTAANQKSRLRIGWDTTTSDNDRTLTYAKGTESASSADVRGTISPLDSGGVEKESRLLSKNILDAPKENAEAKPKSIYFYPEFFSFELKTGKQLLQNALSYVREAIEQYEEGRIKDSDETMMEFAKLLPELFCCRTISESFGAVINAIDNALYGLKGEPLSDEQLKAVERLLNHLYTEPRMSFEDAVEYISEFEGTNFDVLSPGLEGLMALVEMLDEPHPSINAG